jgi:molybdopterin-guanine dinucleotide biosynthesis protein A
MATDFSAILLAGGRSTRMGRDKALLDWRGRPLIEHMLDLLRIAGAGHVVTSGDRPGWPGVPDRWPGRGPVAGIASALPRCPDGPLVVVPIDLPLLDPARVSSLLSALSRAPAVHFAEHPLPCAVDVAPAMRALTGDMARASPAGASIRAWLTSCGAMALAAGDASDLRPCNTPADYAALLR